MQVLGEQGQATAQQRPRASARSFPSAFLPDTDPPGQDRGKEQSLEV